MTPFKMTVIGIFIFLIVLGVLTFAKLGTTSNGPGALVTIWGTIPNESASALIKNVNQQANVINARYVEKSEATFDSDLVNALAEGNGPDVVIIPDSQINRLRNKIFTIPFANYPQRTFQDTFIDEGQLFLNSTGVVGVPILVDPLVLYWNKDIFASANIPNPPKYWSDLSSLAPKIIAVDNKQNIQRALVSFGEFSNVTNAKAILSAMFLQAGNPIVTRNPSTDEIVSVLDQNLPGASTAASVLDFYNQFSDPSNKYYSWNRSMPNSLDAFLAGNLALYVGYASEASQIRAKNPNLNFDVAVLPVPDQNSTKITYGKLYAMAITKNSTNVAGSLSAILALTSQASVTFLSDQLSLPPVRRDLLAVQAPDSYQAVFYQAALQSRGWFDPDPDTSNVSFQNMVESVATNQRSSSDAIMGARVDFQSIIKKTQTQSQ